MKDASLLAGHPELPPNENDVLARSYSFRFYTDDVNHIARGTKDSIDNFLKTISEMENEFATIFHGEEGQHDSVSNFSSLTFSSANAFLEENY
ncbi:MAG TPA: hypothetical protein VGC95_08010 [Chitinophagaceae bacterium]